MTNITEASMSCLWKFRRSCFDINFCRNYLIMPSNNFCFISKKHIFIHGRRVCVPTIVFLCYFVFIEFDWRFVLPIIPFQQKMRFLCFFLKIISAKMSGTLLPLRQSYRVKALKPLTIFIYANNNDVSKAVAFC